MVWSMVDKPALRFAATLAVFLTASTALAQPPVPRPKPDPASYSRSLPAEEFDAMARALDAAEDGDWTAVRAIQGVLTDPVAKKLLQWRIATADERSTFFELSSAVRNLQGWPNTNAMIRDAEYALGDMAAGTMNTQDIIRWFADFPPQTGDGKVAYAEALLNAGETEAGRDLLRDAWRNNAMRRDTQRRVMSRYADMFSQDDTLERIDYLAFADQRNMVRDLLPLLPDDYRRLYEARLAIAGDDPDLLARLRAVPERLQDDAGLLYERARRLRRNGDEDEAVAALRAVAENPKSLTGKTALWSLRHVLARETLEAGNREAAYDLVKDSGLESGADFAEAEFLAGWIALRFLNQPDTAEEHFRRLAEGVSTPVSLSRGWYWVGRAREADGDESDAAEAYARAAEHSSAFYGQLAMTELDPNAVLTVQPDPQPGPEGRAAFENRELVRALHMLGELDQQNTFFAFAQHLEDELNDPQELALLSDLALDYGLQRTALRVAKDARNRTLPIYERAFPVAFTPPSGPGYVEPALALAISRQETEFDPRAVSGANARGLMQLLPSTAETEARRAGLPYRQSWLLDDPGYNAQLGSAHLDGLIQNYNGSYIVSMAAYNAGPGRARQWIERFGNPRAGGVDPIDWIEFVPFGETRNYIQRVMENLQVYRAQLNGGSAPLQIAEDLRRGEVPQAAFH